MEVGDLAVLQRNKDPFEQLSVVVSLDQNTDGSIYAVKVFKMDGRMLWVRPANIRKVYSNV
jgi:hypothetical protein